MRPKLPLNPNFQEILNKIVFTWRFVNLFPPFIKPEANATRSKGLRTLLVLFFLLVMLDQKVYDILYFQACLFPNAFYLAQILFISQY